MEDEVAPGSLITIVIADDHQVVRAGLRLLLEAEEGFEVLAEAGDVPTTERSLNAYRPSVLILDLTMPGESSLAAIPRMRGTWPDTRIVVLTMHNDPAFAREALRAAAGPPDDVTAREVEVLRLIALGHTNEEIASTLHLSVRTIESHRAHIQQKTRLTTRAELVAYARDHGLL